VNSSAARYFVRWTGKALLWLVLSLLALAVAGAIYQAIATERAERAYPPPGEMVDVGGYSLHINCAGQGSPTVVLDAVSGEMSADWVRVQRKSRWWQPCKTIDRWRDKVLIHYTRSLRNAPSADSGE
jgi:hypothetical protein